MGNNIGIGILVLAYCAILVIYLSKESKNKKQEYVKTGIGCLGMIGLIWFINYSNQYDLNHLKQNKAKSIAEVIGFGRKSAIKWKFTTSTKKTIEIFDNKRFNGLQIGEFYEIEYDSIDLKNARVDLSKPVLDFIQRDTIYKISFPHGKISNSNFYATFQYRFKGIEYIRQQELPEYGNWEDIKKFIVVINSNNPKIGYLIPQEEE
ncbi:MAG: hypothetical protein AB8G22_18165 [Saprospiraceae bacterium]